MKNISFVVQRAGRDLVGGAEGYVLSQAELLSEYFNVTIITTTAKDYMTWKNEYPEKDEVLSPTLRIKRFRVDFERPALWFRYNAILTDDNPVEDFSVLPGNGRERLISRIKGLPLGFCEEWIRMQGPYSSGLYEYLREDESDHLIFKTYLYPTTYFGLDAVKDRSKAFLIPTYHDEPSAYLPIFRKYAGVRHLFNTKTERAFAEKELYGAELPGEILGYGIEDWFADTAAGKSSEIPYLLYAGRLEEAKGVGRLFEMFGRYHSKNPGIRLYTIGDGHLKNHRGPGIEYKGFVSEGEKLRLMKNALALAHPSAFESLGIVILEAFMMGTPAVVNSKCSVLREHIVNSGAGFGYSDYDEFERALDALAADHGLREDMSSKARTYFLENYSLGAYTDRLLRMLGAR